MPNDDDLTGIVTHLTSLTTRRGSVQRDPNEPEVRWLLEAGVRALGEAVLQRSSRPGDPVAYINANGMFDALPLERVMSAFRDMCREHGIDPGSANKARLIRRWSFAANYQLDLVAYVFRPEVHLHRLQDAQEKLHAALAHLTLGELVDHLATQETELSPIATIYRLQHVMRMMFPGDEGIRRLTGTLYDMLIDRWAQAYAGVSRAYALGIREDDDSLTDLAVTLSLVIEGGFVRGTALPRHVRCADGTPAVCAAVRSVVAAAVGRPWAELEGLRADVTRLADAVEMTA